MEVGHFSLEPPYWKQMRRLRSSFAYAGRVVNTRSKGKAERDDTH